MPTSTSTAFEHVAFFDREREWIEMRPARRAAMDVHVGRLGLDVSFAPREELRTEISAKFTIKRLGADLAGVRPRAARRPHRPRRALRAVAQRPPGG
jgi:uncharacterized SAM-dependent methyltransferase